MFEKHSEIPGREALEKGTTRLLLLIVVVLMELMKFSKVIFLKRLLD